MIEHQVKELREMSIRQRSNAKASEKVFFEIENVLSKAADAIEALSAKLAEANMDRSDRYYDVRKELVEQYNKTFELINKMPLEGNEVWHGYVGGVMQTLGL